MRSALAEDGDLITHSEALELVARQYSYRDWNTLFAAADHNRPEPYSVGARVSGAYLGHPFTGEVQAVCKIADGARYDLTVVFDEPVDVVKSEHFSAFRKRVSTRVNPGGVSDQRTSDGEPHMRLQRQS